MNPSDFRALREEERALRENASLADIAFAPSMEALGLEALAETKFIADLCVRLWRVEKQLNRMAALRTDDSEVLRLHRRFSEAMDVLHEGDCEILDLTGQKFDLGLRLRVLQYLPQRGLHHETIIETVKPTLRLRGVVVPGEVIVGVPEDDDRLE